MVVLLKNPLGSRSIWTAPTDPSMSSLTITMIPHVARISYSLLWLFETCLQFSSSSTADFLSRVDISWSDILVSICFFPSVWSYFQFWLVFLRVSALIRFFSCSSIPFDILSVYIMLNRSKTVKSETSPVMFACVVQVYMYVVYVDGVRYMSVHLHWRNPGLTSNYAYHSSVCLCVAYFHSNSIHQR